MNLKIKRVLAFAMTLTMLLGCFVFSTAAVEAPGNGDIVCSGNDSTDGISFVVRTGDINGVENGYTMYLYDDGGEGAGGWGRPISADLWGTPTFYAGFTETDGKSVADWCKANVTTLVVHSGVVALAGDAFKDYSKLEYVEVNTANIKDTATQPLFFSRGSLFESCPLKAIYQTGNTPESGVADLTFSKFLGGDTTGQRTPFYGNNTTIKTVKLGSEVYFYTPEPFQGLNGLEKVIIETTDAAKVTTPKDGWFNSGWPLILPAGCTVECANQEVAEKFSRITYFDDTMVTYPGEPELCINDNGAPVRGDNKWAAYAVYKEGNENVMYVSACGSDETNNFGGLTDWGFGYVIRSEVEVPIDDHKANLAWCKENVTKVVLVNINKLGDGKKEGAFEGYTALKTVELCAEMVEFSVEDAFSGCTSLESIYLAGAAPVKGVADLSCVTDIGGANILSGTKIVEVKLGEKIAFKNANPFDGMSALKVVRIAAVDTANVTFGDGLNISVPKGVTIECANADIAGTFTSDGHISAENVTYAGETVTAKFAQTTAVNDGKYNVRFAAVGTDTTYDKVGFEIIATNVDGKNWSGDTTIVYTSITGTSATGAFTKTAADNGGAYIYTLTIKDIPTSVGEVRFLVRPYAVVDGVTVYGYSGIITVGGAN